MRIAIIGSRSIRVENLALYLPPETTEIVSGGARGVDQCAAQYARAHGLQLTEFLPEYARYGRAAPLVRNRAIVDYADEVLAFWDGSSAGTRHVIRYCKKLGRRVRVILPPELEKRCSP